MPTRARNRLADYDAKRDFAQTAEPSGKRPKPRAKPRAKAAAKKARKRRPIFVVQHHKASHDHHDFRLEHDGALLSWAVPRHVSTKIGDRRLAVQVEDHPLDYATFEGTIPEGNYGAGWTLVRMRPREGEASKKPQWLLMRHHLKK